MCSLCCFQRARCGVVLHSQQLLICVYQHPFQEASATVIHIVLTNQVLDVSFSTAETDASSSARRNPLETTFVMKFFCATCAACVVFGKGILQLSARDATRSRSPKANLECIRVRVCCLGDFSKARSLGKQCTKPAKSQICEALTRPVWFETVQRLKQNKQGLAPKP